LLVLMVGAVGALASAAAGLLATISAYALLLAAAATHRLDSIVLYLGCVAFGWLIGFLMRTQRSLLAAQIQAQQALAEQAADDERRRIAREVHDVIAHSLSITLLHLTGARRGLQQDRDIDDAVDSLKHAERLGRQAMADIRRTVGLLDDHPATSPHTAPNLASKTSPPSLRITGRRGSTPHCAPTEQPIGCPQQSVLRCTASPKSHWPTSPNTQPIRDLL
jgi:hypothetical protein